jgi:hypothetical protein
VTNFVTLLHFAAIRFELLHRFHDVTPAHDCVPLEYAPRPPPADLHNYRFGDSGAAKVPGRSPAKIMEDESAVLRSLLFTFGAGASPCMGVEQV